MVRRLVCGLMLACACERGRIPVGARPVSTGPFLAANGQPALPYSDARFSVDRDFLYVTLYAADEDIRSSDRFTISIAPMSFQAGPAGATARPEVRVAVVLDETLDDPSDLDEEWRVDLAIPLFLIDTQPTRVSLERCDSPRAGGRHCGRFADTLRLLP